MISFLALLHSLKAFIFSLNLLYAALGLFGIGFIIAWHELGHLLMSKLFRVKTPSFSIGIGPRLWSRKIGTTTYIIAPIPFGGYIEMLTEPETEEDRRIALEEGELFFNDLPYLKKICIISGGILFNLIFAYTTFICLYAVGMPDNPFVYPENADAHIAHMLPGSPAARAGIQEGDTITAYNGIPMTDVSTFLQHLAASREETISLDLVRLDAPLKLEVTRTPGQLLGVVFTTHPIAPQPFLSAISKGVHRTNSFIKRTVATLGSILSKGKVNELGGPIMIISQSISHAALGLTFFLLFLALISISLAVLNLIPLPILDGGQMVILSIEALIRRQLSATIKSFIFIVTAAAMLLLTLYISFKDVLRLKDHWSATNTTQQAPADSQPTTASKQPTT